MLYIQRGESPVHFIAKHNSKECMELLLSHGANVNTCAFVSLLLLDYGGEQSQTFFKINIVF